VSRATLCLHGIQELQKTWEVTNWVLQLFFQYLDRSTAASLRVQHHDNLLGLSSGSKWSAVPSPNIKAQQSAPTDASNHTSTVNPSTENAIGQPMMDSDGATPWSWTSDEANQFLFSRIESEFAFGEGEILDWNPEDLEFGQSFFPPPEGDPSNFWVG
jgi:hypothetical protein